MNFHSKVKGLCKPKIFKHHTEMQPAALLRQQETFTVTIFTNDTTNQEFSKFTTKVKVTQKESFFLSH